MAKRKQKILRRLLFRGALLVFLVLLLTTLADFAVGVLAKKSVPNVDPNYYYNVIGEDKIVALTFDDGPDPEKPPR